nr:immunoglobulin light chain junction region [Macaca mulatta]MOV78903.1 immunoglobulin light chain junction region [Macaca mulatta]
CLQYKTFPFTF